MKSEHFLLELGVEEIPPRFLKTISDALAQNFATELQNQNLDYRKIQTFATPRRLAILVFDLALQAPVRMIERKGPAIDAPKKAVSGFAKSCGVEIDKLSTRDFHGQKYYFFENRKKGERTVVLLEKMVHSAILKIPLERPMRWGNLEDSFIRPLNWLVMLLGNRVVPAMIFGVRSGRKTRGLRFSKTRNFNLQNAADYPQVLKKRANIEVDFEKRAAKIRRLVVEIAKKNHAEAVVEPALLTEISALVESPAVFCGHFDPRFLKIPSEALIEVLRVHQKYFHALDQSGRLLPIFIAVANAGENADLEIIKNGNERVIRARLYDAEFFWRQDISKTLAARAQKLKTVLFVKPLGNMADKTKRLVFLAGEIARKINADVEIAKRAATLCKADLTSAMVGEFAALQGVMGAHLAKNDGEDPNVVQAIYEHYQPRFAADELPATPAGVALSLADKLDTVVGIFASGQKPSESNDPYALRRLALGILRMMIEKRLNLDLAALIEMSLHRHDFSPKYDAAAIFEFTIRRLKIYYREQNIGGKIFEAVWAVHPTVPLDFDNRIRALNDFAKKEEAKHLVALNKRIKNILKNHDENIADLNEKMFCENAERALFHAGERVGREISAGADYAKIIRSLLKLETVIGDFFDQVMVNTDDAQKRAVRLELLRRVRARFLAVADISDLF